MKISSAERKRERKEKNERSGKKFKTVTVEELQILYAVQQQKEK